MNPVVIIPAAGSGSRLGLDQPKAFVPVAGRTILQRCLDGVLAAGIRHIVIAVPGELVEDTRELIAQTIDGGAAGATVEVIAGGAERVDSVRLAVEFIASAAGLSALGLSAAPETVLVHDAARCMTPVEVFDRVQAALAAGHKNVVPALPVVDTVRICESSNSVRKRATTTAEAVASAVTQELQIVDHGWEAKDTTCEAMTRPIDRTLLRRVQTPQGFAFAALAQAHARNVQLADPSATDDASLVENIGIRAVGVEGAEEALKITHPLDLKIAQLLAAESDATRTAASAAPAEASGVLL